LVRIKNLSLLKVLIKEKEKTEKERKEIKRKKARGERNEKFKN
jgi:hypothetical protein